MNYTIYTNTIFKVMEDVASKSKAAYLSPELFLYTMLYEKEMNTALSSLIKTDDMIKELTEYINDMPSSNSKPIMSTFMNDLLNAVNKKTNGNTISTKDLINQMFNLDNSFVQMLLSEYVKIKKDILTAIENVEVKISSSVNPNVEFDFSIYELNEKQAAAANIPNGNPNRGASKSIESIAPCLNGKCNKPIIGRKYELDRTIQILARANKNNPIHVGEPGVGKTAIVEGLVQMIDSGNVPDILKNSKVYSLTVGDLVAGTQYRGDLEGKLKKLLQTLEKEENAILYIDEIHTIVGAGSSSGGLDVSNMLKPYLTTGKIKVIGATTEDEYKKYFIKDKALSRRFQKVTVSEPTIEETIEIVDGLKEYYEDYHKIVYKDEALKTAVELSAKYVNDRFLPDKAIDLIDEAGAYLNTHEDCGNIVDKSLIEDILSKTCNIPKVTVETDEAAKLKVLDTAIKADLYGQDKAVEDVVRAIKISRAGLIDDNKPIAAMLMVGPTGVGKTEFAKTLANKLGINFVKFDMSEYMDKTSVNKLIGSSAGYVGYEEGGILVDTIRKKPHCVLLLDEIEKAHPDVFNILLQVMDDAVLTDNQGNKADFKNVIILMTSNAGATDVNKASIGFETNTVNLSAMSDAVNKTFTPEFRNRLTGTVVFNPMDENMATLIAKKQLRLLEGKMPQVSLKFSKDVISYIVNKGLEDKQYGGRAIKRVIENELKPLFVDEILFGKLKDGGRCNVKMKDGKFQLLCRKKVTTKVNLKTAANV